MKTYPYVVAIHCSKALFLRIGRQYMFKVHIVYPMFHFQRTCICPSVWHRHVEHFETHLHV